VAIAIVLSHDQVLVGRRSAGVLEGFDEFPGGKVEPGESPDVAAIRECREESGLNIQLSRQLIVQPYAYRHGEVQLHFFSATPCSPEQRPREPFRWVARTALRNLRFPRANRSILQLLENVPPADLLAPAMGR
jgi:8-oxo-dGTP diphosphatase